MTMHDRFRALCMELMAWRQWARTASHEEDGWESDAPNWQELVNHAQELLVASNLSPEQVAAVETVFCLSEEDEAMADFMKANYERIEKDTIRALAASRKPQVRWQVYDSLVVSDKFSSSLLLTGFEDADDYVRRRAFLRLLSTAPPPLAVLERAANDVDAVIRDEARKHISQHPPTL